MPLTEEAARQPRLDHRSRGGDPPSRRRLPAARGQSGGPVPGRPRVPGQCGPCVHGLDALADDHGPLAVHPRSLRDGVSDFPALCSLVEGRGACPIPTVWSGSCGSALRVFEAPRRRSTSSGDRATRPHAPVLPSARRPAGGPSDEEARFDLVVDPVRCDGTGYVPNCSPSASVSIPGDFRSSSPERIPDAPPRPCAAGGRQLSPAGPDPGPKTAAVGLPAGVNGGPNRLRTGRSPSAHRDGRVHRPPRHQTVIICRYRGAVARPAADPDRGIR